MKKFFWPVVLCLVSGCSDMTTFTPHDECEEGAVSQSDAGDYYLCRDRQWHKLGGMPLCRMDDRKVEENRNICEAFSCVDSLHWTKINNWNSERNSCRNINGVLDMGECFNGAIQCDENLALNVCIAGEFYKIPKEVADCSCNTSDPCINAESGIGVFCGSDGIKHMCTENDSDKGISCKGDGTSRECGLCLNGNVLCEDGNKICENGMYRSCQGEECSVCETCHENGVKKCKDKRIVMVCQNEEWIEDVMCLPGETCENGKCVGERKLECLPDGGRRCIEIDGIPHVEKCHGGSWVRQEECKNGCDNNIGRCNPEPDICHGRGNDALCDGNEVVICRDGKVDERLEKVENKFCKDGRFACAPGYALKGNSCEQLENYCSVDDAFECIDSGYTICINHVLNTVNCLEPSTCNQEKRCCVTADGTCTVSSECTDDNGIRYIVNGEERNYSCGFGAVCEKKNGVAKCVENCDDYLNGSDYGIICYENDKYIGLCTNDIENAEELGNGKNVRTPVIMGDVDYINDVMSTDYLSRLKNYYSLNDNEWIEIMSNIQNGLSGEGHVVEVLYKQGDTFNNNVYRILYKFVERAYFEWIGMRTRNNIGYIGQCRTEADGVVGYKFVLFEKYRKNMSVFYGKYKECLTNEGSNTDDITNCMFSRKDEIRDALDKDFFDWLEGKDLRFKDKDDARGPVFKMFDVVHDDKKREVVEKLIPKTCQNYCNYFDMLLIGVVAYEQSFINILDLLHTVLFEYYKDNRNALNTVEKCENGCRIGYCLKACSTPGLETELGHGFVNVCSEDGFGNIVEKTL